MTDCDVGCLSTSYAFQVLYERLTKCYVDFVKALLDCVMEVRSATVANINATGASRLMHHDGHLRVTLGLGAYGFEQLPEQLPMPMMVLYVDDECSCGLGSWGPCINSG